MLELPLNTDPAVQVSESREQRAEVYKLVANTPLHPQDSTVERTIDPYIAYICIPSIPTEVLCMIFEAGKALSAEYPFEILVSHVTRHWRAAAVSHARLWTRVVLDTSTQHAVEMGEAYFDRSRALPLDLIYRIKRPSMDDSYSLQIVASMSGLIYSQAGRWDRLRIKTGWTSALTYFLTNLPTKAPILQSLEISLNHPIHSEQHDLIPAKIFTGGSPLLTSLLLRGVAPRGFPPLMTVSSLHIHTPFNVFNCEIAWSAFQRLSSLSHLVLTNIRLLQKPSNPIEFPALKTLSFYYLPDVDQILETISAPLLHTVYIDPMNSTEMYGVASWASTASLYPSLRSLSIGLQTDVPVIAWHGVMRVFPKVTQFTILGTQVNDFLEALEKASASLWPELKTLSIPEADFAQPLEQMLSQRQAVGCPIQRLQLSTAVKSNLGGVLPRLQGQTEVQESNVCEAMAPSYFTQWLSEEEVDQDEVDEYLRDSEAE